MTYKIETNIISEEFQKKMRELLHDYLVGSPQGIATIAKEIGITRFVLHNFLFKEKVLRAKESYILLKFLHTIYSAEFYQ